MISTFRNSLSSWVVRGFFLVLVASFAFWGIGDVVKMGGNATWIAKVGDHAIEPPELDSAYRRDMQQLARTLPAGQDPSLDIKRAVARQALDRLIAQAAIGEEVAKLHLLATDDAIRNAIFGIPGFQGPDGKFSRSKYENALRTNGLSEPRFLDLMRRDIAQTELLQAVRAGVAAPESLAVQAFAYQNEQRSADLAEFPLATSVAPAEAAGLTRWYDNHPDLYSTPQLRKIKAAILSPKSLERDIVITDDDLRTAYDKFRPDFVKPAKRTAEVILVQDEAVATKLAADWRAGASWADMQARATAAGGSAVELNDASEAEFPALELGRAVFSVAPDVVADPGKSALGWHVVRVTKATPGVDPSFETLKPDLRDRLLAERAAAIIYDRANKVDNILASGSTLDELPGDLGLVAVSGTLDTEGKTLDGNPAPIPGGDEVRNAVVAAAFQSQKGDSPRLSEVTLPGGGSAYFALVVEELLPSMVRPFDEVKDQVAADLARDTERHVAEQAAAKLLTALKGGQGLADAATVAGVKIVRTPMFGRADPAAGVAPEVAQLLFTLKPNEPGMVETPAGFTIVVPAEIRSPDPKADPAGFARIREVLTRSVGDDMELAFAAGLRNRAGVQINNTLLSNFIQP